MKISIIDDEQDILTLYKDYLIGRGHEVLSFLNADNILKEFVKNLPDIVLMDYKMAGHKNGIDAAIEILANYPLFPILFITAYDRLREDLLNYSIFKDKKVSVLLKPILLQDIEYALLKLVKH